MAGGWSCVECHTRFAQLATTFRIASLVLGLAAITLAIMGQFIGFALCAVAALYLTGPPKCPRCGSRATVRSGREPPEPVRSGREPPAAPPPSS
jgi:hypothetical protein